MITADAMATEREAEITGLLKAWSQGDGEALERLAPLVYGELCELAAVYRRGESPGHTLLTRDLVHEAYLRLVGREPVDWQSRCHFFGVAGPTSSWSTSRACPSTSIAVSTAFRSASAWSSSRRYAARSTTPTRTW